MTRFTVTGINDNRDFCECCGKSGLQRVVWIFDNETHEEKHFGTSCAMKPAKGFDCIDEIKAEMRNINARVKLAWSVAYRRYRAEGGAMINGRDKDGSPIATPANMSRYIAIRQEEISKVYG